jgi:hypothetical protein
VTLIDLALDAVIRAGHRVATAALVLALTLLLARAGAGTVSAATPQRHEEAERLGLALLNCTRSGGWVRADGSCKGYDTGVYSRRLRALRLHDGISRKVAFRWAGQMARADLCDHVIPGQPELSSRFSSAGYRDGYIGENLGCAWGSMAVADMVIATHRSMQAEKGTRGWHWRNIKSSNFKSVGIGVATLGGIATIVYDFYGR